MEFHDDPMAREELIRDYLLKRLDSNTTEAFESHYIYCDECFEELRASRLLVSGLGRSKVEVHPQEDVVVLQFASPARLTRESQEIREVSAGVLQQKDTRVLIDLSKVSKIDSAGLGLLMTCYSHVVKNQGMLKLLNPNAEVQDLLQLTKTDSVLETYFDKNQALKSFSLAELSGE